MELSDDKTESSPVVWALFRGRRGNRLVEGTIVGGESPTPQFHRGLARI